MSWEGNGSSHCKVSVRPRGGGADGLGPGPRSAGAVQRGVHHRHGGLRDVALHRDGVRPAALRLQLVGGVNEALGEVGPRGISGGGFLITAGGHWRGS